MSLTMCNLETGSIAPDLFLPPGALKEIKNIYLENDIAELVDLGLSIVNEAVESCSLLWQMVRRH
jgi:hypothetical protein